MALLKRNGSGDGSHRRSGSAFRRVRSTVLGLWPMPCAFAERRNRFCPVQSDRTDPKWEMPDQSPRNDPSPRERSVPPFETPSPGWQKLGYRLLRTKIHQTQLGRVKLLPLTRRSIHTPRLPPKTPNTQGPPHGTGPTIRSPNHAVTQARYTPPLHPRNGRSSKLGTCHEHAIPYRSTAWTQ